MLVDAGGRISQLDRGLAAPPLERLLISDDDSIAVAVYMDDLGVENHRVWRTETGERLPDKPSNSYRNILRAGFTEAYVRQNYLSPLPA